MLNKVNKALRVELNVSNVYLDRDLDYNIEYGRAKHDDKASPPCKVKMQQDIYISVRTNAWALINVKLHHKLGEQEYNMYKKFKPFDYEDSSSTILSRINFSENLFFFPNEHKQKKIKDGKPLNDKRQYDDSNKIVMPFGYPVKDKREKYDS